MPPQGGGAPCVIERWYGRAVGQGMILPVIDDRHRVPNRPKWGHHQLAQGINLPNVVITSLHRVSQSTFLAMARLHRLSTGSHTHSVIWQARDSGGGEDLLICILIGCQLKCPQLDWHWQGISEVCNIATGYAFESFLARYKMHQGGFFVRRAQHDRVRFWTPQRHPPIQLRSRLTPPPGVNPGDRCIHLHFGGRDEEGGGGGGAWPVQSLHPHTFQGKINQSISRLMKMLTKLICDSYSSLNFSLKCNYNTQGCH